jgi:hypothetical protein
MYKKLKVRNKENFNDIKSNKLPSGIRDFSDAVGSVINRKFFFSKIQEEEVIIFKVKCLSFSFSLPLFVFFNLDCLCILIALARECETHHTYSITFESKRVSK